MKINYLVIKGNEIEDLELQVSLKREAGWNCEGGVCVTAVSDVSCQDTNGELIETTTDLIYYQAMTTRYV